MGAFRLDLGQRQAGLRARRRRLFNADVIVAGIGRQERHAVVRCFHVVSQPRHLGPVIIGLLLRNGTLVQQPLDTLPGGFGALQLGLASRQKAAASFRCCGWAPLMRRSS